ncbi:MAG TPA: FAD-dependent oxidoreductase [Terriglobales bacterium]|nr:FAD-dependent oxidoreductase [Terriglobales bacterium]
MRVERQKVVILGGGVGAMSAAFELTSAPDWQSKYDVTVYQMGWRLGGKGASGRNAKYGQRIEEHGLHFWLGFYENAFRMIRKCYEENARPLTDPLATWREAFKPCNEITVEDEVNGKWTPWLLQFPPNPDTPGDTLDLPSVWEMLGTAIEFLRNLHANADLPQVVKPEEHGVAGTLKHLWARVEGEWNSLKLDAGAALLRGAEHHIKATAVDGTHQDAESHTFLIGIMDSYWGWLQKTIPRKADGAFADERWRRFTILAEFVLANVRGIIADGVLIEGFAAIEQYDYKEWLGRHGASEQVQNCGIVRAFYDLCFNPFGSVAAGTYLKGMLRILFTYRGAVYWKMQAGMGDVIFAPMYEVLKKRGVKFKFFYKITGLHLSADNRTIASIGINRQATVKTPEYKPFVHVKRLPCWPSEPLYEQLVEGKELQAKQINLESYWADWKGVDERPLEYDKDFHIVVFGISMGSVPILCSELIQARPEWRAMADNVRTMPTQSFQTWFYPDTSGLGWVNWQNEAPLVTAFTEPMDTFADMEHLLIREDWPSKAQPGTIGYFCGPMAVDPGIPTPAYHEFPKKQWEIVYEGAVQFMKELCPALLPKLTRANGDVDWSLLVDPDGGAGEVRFRNQYFRANIDPSERYVLSVKGSTRFRLHAAASGFENLYLAGDWTDNGVNAGCVEAAVISGIQAADGILERPKTAIADGFGEKQTLAAGK